MEINWSSLLENIKTGARLLYIITIIIIIIIIIIVIIIIIIISTIKDILEEKEKAVGWEGTFTNKTVWICLYACYLDNNFFVCLFAFWSFSCKKNNFFRIYKLVFVNLMKIKIKIY